MSPTSRPEARFGIATLRSAVSGLFLLGFGAALSVCHATGLTLPGLAAVAVGSFGLQYLVSDVVADDAFRAVRGAADPPTAIERTIGDLAVDMGIDAPRAVLEPDGESVTILGDGDRTVLIVGESLVADLDDEALRSVIAHELAHVALGHFRRLPVRRPITHVVGFTALWALALQHVTLPFAAMGGAAYIAAGAGRTDGVVAVLYVVASAGVVLLPVALSAYASRLEECQADDAAVAQTSAVDFCTGLYRVGEYPSRRDGSVVGRATPAGRRSALGRLTAVHPSVDYRLKRQGFAAGDFDG